VEEIILMIGPGGKWLKGPDDGVQRKQLVGENKDFQCQKWYTLGGV